MASHNSETNVAAQPIIPNMFGTERNILFSTGPNWHAVFA